MQEADAEVSPTRLGDISAAGADFYPSPPKIARRLARFMPGLGWEFVAAFEKTRTYGDEFIKYPRDQKLETNFYVGEG